MALKIGIINQKGGVGKTTTATVLTDAFTRLGYKTLLIDFDAQANSTSLYGCTPDKTIADVISGKTHLKDIIFTESEMGDLAPSGRNLIAEKDALLAKPGADLRLKKALDTVNDSYEVIIIDSNPSADILTRNVLTAADGVIIPTELETFAIDGLINQINTLTETKEYVNEDLELYGVLITDFDTTNSTQKDYQGALNQLKENGIHVFDTFIRHSKAIPSVQRWRNITPDTKSNEKIIAAKGSLFAYDKNNNGAKNYYDFAVELLKRIEEINNQED